MRNLGVFSLFPFTILALLSIIQSCNLKSGHNKMQKILLEECDELNIIYYGKDSFVFKDFDSSHIRNYIDLITLDNDTSIPDCDATGRLIFKHKGQRQFAAEISIKDINDSLRCNNVKYQLNSKEYRHFLTYQTGRGIDEIYWHRVNPQNNPWTGVDSSKFHYEDLGKHPD